LNEATESHDWFGWGGGYGIRQGTGAKKSMSVIGVLTTGWPWPGFSPDPIPPSANPVSQALSDPATSMGKT
jgi:hypothetical protein